MQASETQLFNTLTGAEEFLGEHSALLGNVPASGARQRLNISIRALEMHGNLKVEQKVSASTLAQSKSAARRTLVIEHLAPIAAAARAELAATPEVAVVRTVPHANGSYGMVIKRAIEVEKAASLRATELIRAGLPSDFLAGLRAARQALEAATKGRSTSLNKTRGAATGVRQHLIDGRKQIRILDRLVRVALRGQDGALLDEWKGRTAYPRKSSAVVTTTTDTPSAAA